MKNMNLFNSSKHLQNTMDEALPENTVAGNSEKARGEASGPNKKHLLIAEDIEINQVIAEHMLKKMGYTVDIANNGQEAIEMLNSNDYHAVLMDIQMPVLDGLAATKKIRSIEKFKDLPIIALSSHARSEDREKSLEHGMNDHLTKPIDSNILAAALNRWLTPRPAEHFI